MHFTTRSFIGRTDELCWSQYWENEPDDPSLASQRGHLFALINLEVADGLAGDVGHLIINEINQTYFSSLDVPTPNWLKRTLETIFHNHRSEMISLSLTVAIIHHEQLHLAVLNQGFGVFHRGTKISKIITGIDDQVLQISGSLKDQDQLLLCTPDFLNNFTWDKIKSNLSLNSIQDIEESFLLDLSSIDDQSATAGVLIQIHYESDPADTEVVIPAKPSVIPSTPIRTPKTNIFKSLFKSRPVFVSHLDTDSHQKRKRLNIIFSLLVMAALFVSIFFGARRNQAQQIENQYQSLKSEFTTKLNNAAAIKNINLESAQSQAKEAKVIIAKMVPLKVHTDEINQFTASVDKLLTQTGSADVYVPESFYDTGLIGGSASYSQLFIAKNLLYLLDSTTGRIDQLDIGNKSLKKILNANIAPNIDSFAENSGNVYVLKDKQISEVVANSLVQKIDLTKDVKDFESGSFNFWNGSLYLLVNDSTIWKFAPNAGGFSAGSVWLKEGESLPPSATSFAINGEVWVIGASGSIMPFTRGVHDTFKSKTTTVTADAKNLVTSPDSDVLAFTDKDNLVYIYGKDGSSASSYNFDKHKILSLALSASTKQLFVLCSDQVIYQIKL